MINIFLIENKIFSRLHCCISCCSNFFFKKCQRKQNYWRKGLFWVIVWGIIHHDRQVLMTGFWSTWPCWIHGRNNFKCLSSTALSFVLSPLSKHIECSLSRLACAFSPKLTPLIVDPVNLKINISLHIALIPNIFLPFFLPTIKHFIRFLMD